MSHNHYPRGKRGREDYPHSDGSGNSRGRGRGGGHRQRGDDGSYDGHYGDWRDQRQHGNRRREYEDDYRHVDNRSLKRSKVDQSDHRGDVKNRGQNYTSKAKNSEHLKAAQPLPPSTRPDPHPRKATKQPLSILFEDFFDSKIALAKLDVKIESLDARLRLLDERIACV
jgi:hypothetical protein|eukprot:Stramenopile-MAST_4_protein_703